GFKPADSGCIALIGYDNALYRGATVSASSAAPGFPANSVTNPLTYERWLAQPSDAQPTITIDTLTQSDINYVAIGAHTITSGDVILESSPNNSTWTQVAGMTSTNTNAIMFVFADV